MSSLPFQKENLKTLARVILFKWILLYLVSQGRITRDEGAKNRCNKAEGKVFVRLTLTIKGKKKIRYHQY